MREYEHEFDARKSKEDMHIKRNYIYESFTIHSTHKFVARNNRKQFRRNFDFSGYLPCSSISIVFAFFMGMVFHFGFA